MKPQRGYRFTFVPTLRDEDGIVSCTVLVEVAWWRKAQLILRALPAIAARTLWARIRRTG